MAPDFSTHEVLNGIIALFKLMNKHVFAFVVLGMVFLPTVLPANTYNVTGTLDGTGLVTLVGGTTYNATTLRAAVNAVNNAGSGVHTINIPPGTYNLTQGELPVGGLSAATININGQGTPANTTIQHDTSTAVARVFDLDPNLIGGVNVTIQNLKIAHGRNNNGEGGAGIICGLQSPADSTTLINCVLYDNQQTGTTGAAVGGAIQNIGGTLNLNSCTFDSNSAGIFSGGAIYYDSFSPSTGTFQVSNCVFKNNTAGATSSGGGAIYLTAAAGSTLNITDSIFGGNRATGTSAGGAAVYKNGSAALTINRCNFTVNSVQGSSATLNLASGGAVDINSGPATIQYCRFSGNTTAAANKGSAVYYASGSGATLTANDNWWGINTGPGSGTGVMMAGSSSVVPSSWLQLRHTASPSSIRVLNSTTLTASFLVNSSGSTMSVANLAALVQLPITFQNPVCGSLSSAQNAIQSSITATASYTASSLGSGSAAATVDAQTVTANITILDTPPTITGTTAGQNVNDNSTLSPFSNVTLGDVDAPAQTLAVTISLDAAAKGTFSPASLTASGFSDAGGGVFTLSTTATAATTAIRKLVFVPAAARVARGLTETTVFTISANDGLAPAVIDNATSVISLSANHLPVAASDAMQRFAKGGAKVLASALLANDTDVDGDTLTITEVPATSANGATLLFRDGWIHYIPLLAYNLTDTFTYTVNDGHGGTATGSVTVNIRTDGSLALNYAGIQNLGAGKFRVTFHGIPGLAYTVQYADSIVPPINWLTLGSAVADGAGIVTCDDLAGTGSRFYRTTYP